MEFEIFTGARGKKYYCYPDSEKRNFLAVQKYISKRTKGKPEDYKCITVWIRRRAAQENRHGELCVMDYLYTKKVKGAERMNAVVRV